MAPSWLDAKFYIRPGSAARILALLLLPACAACRPRAVVETSPSASAPASGSGSAAAAPATPSSIVLSVYEGSLKEGWQDWGWGPHELGHGAARIRMDSYGGWILTHNTPLTNRFGAFVLDIHSSSDPAFFLAIALGAAGATKGFPEVKVESSMVSAAEDGWKRIVVPWARLNPTNSPFDRVTLRAIRPVNAEWVEMDKIGMTSADARNVGRRTFSGPSRDATVLVDCGAPQHPISPYIYGVAGEYSDWEMGATARRWGGNPTTRFNWKTNAFNLAKDWFFENVSLGSTRGFRITMADNAAHDLRSAMTIPIIGWVAKDGSSNGFPVSVLGPQKATDEFKKDAGNGVRLDGSLLTPGSPTLTSVEAPPDSMAEWVQAMRVEAAKASKHDEDLYILDNEPMLWNSTHRDVHPDPVTYDELLQRTIDYASAIRAADPEALIAGPAEWGWTSYFYSAKDTAVGRRLRPDRRAHGDMPLIPWYLQQIAARETATGTKLLDVLDVHFYPQGNNIYGDAADPDTSARRIRSTRALWDPTYVDESWIAESVHLIPRIKEWVDKYHPGLKTSIGEYNFGGEHHMSGALAEAEALGRFGEQGLTYAFYWVFPPKDSPVYWAFRSFRNFNGHGGHFLEQSVASHGDKGVSLFTSRDVTGKHLVTIALNTDPTLGARTAIRFDGCGTVRTRDRFTYEDGDTAIVDEGMESGGLDHVVLPPYSITVMDMSVE